MNRWYRKWITIKTEKGILKLVYERNVKCALCLQEGKGWVRYGGWIEIGDKSENPIGLCLRHINSITIEEEGGK